MTNMQDWKLYEQQIARYYEKMYGDAVVYDAKVRSQADYPRQVDVLLNLSMPLDLKFRVGIEAKYLSKPLDFATFDSLRGKFSSLGVDLPHLLPKRSGSWA